MLNSAKGFLTRRAPAKPWFHDDKNYDEKNEEEKKKYPSNFQTSTTLTPAGNALKGVLYDWVDYTDHVQDNYNEILKNGDGNLIKGIFNTTAKDLAKIGVNIVNETTNQSGAAAKPVIYSDWSPASRLFGMSQETAFSEHLANTAHQREVADLKAAGLNPVLGVSGSGATAVSGSLASSGGSSSAEKAAGVPWLDVLGATAALVATASGKPAVGFMISNLINSFEN